MFNINFADVWPLSSRGPLVSEATALPTEPQPLTVVVTMSPTAIKHALVLYEGPVRFAPACSTVAVCSSRPANYVQLAV